MATADAAPHENQQSILDMRRFYHCAWYCQLDLVISVGIFLGHVDTLSLALSALFSGRPHGGGDGLISRVSRANHL